MSAFSAVNQGVDTIDTTTRVLWVSRHYPGPEQVKDLMKAIPGGITVIQHPRNIRDAEEILELMSKHLCTEVVAVLPIGILADLTHKGVRPIRACMGRSLSSTGGRPRFEHLYFTRVKSAVLEEDRIT